MANFNRLKWIPMVFQAYHEAKMRTGGKPWLSTASGSDADVTVDGASASREHPVEMTPHPRNRTSTLANAKAKRPAHRKRVAVVLQKPWMAPSTNYKRVLRELHATKAKIAAFDRVRLQIDEMERKLATQETLLARLAAANSSSATRNSDP